MDLWEANSISTAYTPHPCTITGQYRCEGTECGDGNNRYGGVCDKDGCDFNSYRMGDKTFYGPGMTVDTTRKFTVVTQFKSGSNGQMNEIRRIYVQDGNIIQNSKVNIPGMDAFDSITPEFCDQQKAAFNDVTSFQDHGGFGPMTTAFQKGMVLVLSLWDDHAVNMLWLDSDYPLDKDPSEPGVSRGTCPTTSGVPSIVEVENANAYVIYSNIKYGPLDSTYGGSSTSTSQGGQQPTSTSSAQPAGQTLWGTSSHPFFIQESHDASGQCGGQGWGGPTTCSQGRCQSYNRTCPFVYSPLSVLILNSPYSLVQPVHPIKGQALEHGIALAPVARWSLLVSLLSKRGIRCLILHLNLQFKMLTIVSFSLGPVKASSLAKVSRP